MKSGTNNLFAYWGGCRGEFVRLLAFTGIIQYNHVTSSDEEEIFFSLHTKRGTIHDKFCSIDKSTGQVKPYKLMDRTGDNYKKFFPIYMDKMRYIGYDDFMTKHILPEMEGLAMLYPTPLNSYSCGHDAHTFIDAFGGLSEFNDYVTRLGFDKVYYITTDKKEASDDIRKAQAIKNTDLDEKSRELIIKNANYEGFYQHMLHYDKIYKEQKRECDVILPVEVVTDKEALRKFFFDNLVDWDDRNYDLIYDLYMEYQK